MKFIVGLIFGLILAAAIPFACIWTGSIDMSAMHKPGMIEEKVGSMAWESAMEKRAGNQANPFADKPDALEAGLDHYQENCFVCHGAPGMKAEEIGQGLNPAPPELIDALDMTDAQLFYVTKNGIRMTGMPAFGPTHSDEEIWKIVAFLRHLPKLTPEEKQQLAQASEEEEHHHEEGMEEGADHEEGETQPAEAEHHHHH